MSEPPQNEEPVQPPPSCVEQATSQATPAKRPPGDDEIQFISSNPVKKTRLTEQKPAQMAQGLMPPPPPPPPKQQTPFPSQTTPVDRHRSLCDIGQTKGTAPDTIPENRGASLPVLERFAFPQSFPPLAAQSSRLSEAISPKQLPQHFPAPPEAKTNASQPLPPPPTPAPQHSVTLDQISCLDFNGVPTSTPGFDLSCIFSGDGGIMEALGMGNMGTSASAPAPPVNSLNNHNAIPFTMYSTGNLMRMPQVHGGSQFPAPFASQPTHHHGTHPPGQVTNHNGQYPANSQHSQVQPQGGNMAPSRSPSPALGAKPPCLHCERIRQEKLWRQVQAPALPVNQQHSRHMPPPPVPAQPGPGPGSMPRSTAADGQPTTVQNTYPNHQHQNQHHPTAQFPTSTPTAISFAPSTHLSLAGPALLQDIAQTVKATFPYALVATRHGVVPAKVAEVVSDMVIKPLMRGAGRPPGMG